MRLQARLQKEIKFERIKEQFGCGYYAVCCHQCCPCKLKNCKICIFQIGNSVHDQLRIVGNLFYIAGSWK